MPWERPPRTERDEKALALKNPPKMSSLASFPANGFGRANETLPQEEGAGAGAETEEPASPFTDEGEGEGAGKVEEEMSQATARIREQSRVDKSFGTSDMAYLFSQPLCQRPLNSHRMAIDEVGEGELKVLEKILDESKVSEAHNKVLV